MIRWAHYKKSGHQEDYKMNFDIRLVKRTFDDKKEWNKHLEEIEGDNMDTVIFTGSPR